MSNEAQDQETNQPPSPAQQDYDEGLELMKKKDYSGAAASFHNALRGFEEAGEEPGIARAVTKLAEVCLLREEYAKALEHFRRAREICRRAQDDLSLTYLQKQLFYTHMTLQQTREALALGLELLDIYHDYNNPAGAVEILEKMAEIHQENGEPLKAAESLRTAAAIHKSFKHSRSAQELLNRAEAIARTS